MPSAIECRDVHLTYGGRERTRAVEALRGIGFEVDEGQFASILGPSGCGKSTLLKIVAGLLPPSSGTVKVFGREPHEARQERTFGFVFQTPVLFPWRTALENAAIMLEVQGVPRSERLATARRHLDLVGLSGFEAYRPGGAVRGMQQRVSIARALSFDPKILLMDEPSEPWMPSPETGWASSCSGSGSGLRRRSSSSPTASPRPSCFRTW